MRRDYLATILPYRSFAFAMTKHSSKLGCKRTTQNQSWLAHTLFPPLCVSYINFVRVLIGSFDYLCPLLLTRVIQFSLGFPTLFLKQLYDDWFVLNCINKSIFFSYPINLVPSSRVSLGTHCGLPIRETKLLLIAWKWKFYFFSVTLDVWIRQSLIMWRFHTPVL